MCCWKCRLVAGGILLAISMRGISQTADDTRHQAIVMEQEGHGTEAEAAWKEILRKHPQDAEAYANFGLLEARQRHYADAISLYRKAAGLRPQMPGLMLNLGLALFKSGDLRGSVHTLAPLLAKSPPASPERQRLDVLLGMAHFGMDDYAAAIPYLEEAARHDQQSLELRMVLVQSCLGAKQFARAQEIYHQILVLNPDSAEADIIAGEMLDEMKDEPGAVREFQAAVKANPAEPNAHFGLGYMLWKLKSYEQAVPEFQAELTNVPNHPLALAYLGDSRMHLQHPEEAQADLEKAERGDSSIELVHLDLGILHANSDRSKDAVRELKTAVKLDPGDATAHWRLAHLYQKLGDRSAATAELQQTQHIITKADDSVFSKLHSAQSTLDAKSSAE
jgi:tetratricopeptide (TPR) repeat protein